jgi:GNAT superfamily N-acetyltransferase
MVMTEQATTNVGSRTVQQQSLDSALTMQPGILLGKIRRRLTRYYRQWFCQQNYIFRHDGPFSREDRSDCTFECYESFDKLPKEVKTDICADGGPSRLETDKLELSENAVIWIAFVDGRVATTVFTRKGKHFRRWFLELQQEDVVVFRLRTHPDFRGQGFAPSLIRYAVSVIADKAGSAYIDCRTYNKPSKRCIEKAGFTCVATKKTIKREWALYE